MRLFHAIWALRYDEVAIAADWPVTLPRIMPLMHPYEVALVALLSTVTENQRPINQVWEVRTPGLAEAKTLLELVARDASSADKHAHLNLENWLVLLPPLRKPGAAVVELPAPNFVTEK